MKRYSVAPFLLKKKNQWMRLTGDEHFAKCTTSIAPAPQKELLQTPAFILRSSPADSPPNESVHDGIL